MRKSAIKKHERHLKWEKAKQEKMMNDILYEQTVPLVNALVDIALTERNPTAINSILDRAYGKARQNIGLDGGAEDKPIVFMPAELMAKYAIKPPDNLELPSGILAEPVPE